MQKELDLEKTVYQRCGRTYKALLRWNVSGVVGWRYSVGEVGRQKCPLTLTSFESQLSSSNLFPELSLSFVFTTHRSLFSFSKIQDNEGNGQHNTYIEANVLSYFKFCILDLYPFYLDFNSESFLFINIQVESQLNTLLAHGMIIGKDTKASVSSSNTVLAAQWSTVSQPKHFVLSAIILDTTGQSEILINDLQGNSSPTVLISQGFQNFQNGKVPTFMDSGVSNTMFVSWDALQVGYSSEG